LRERGFNIGKTESPVTPVFLSGGNNEAANLVIDLRENYNIFCSVVIYPVVPKGVIMLRLIPTAAHSLSDVAETIKAFEAVTDKLRSGFYANSDISIAV
jgi:glycine C-acetyltransferase